MVLLTFLSNIFVMGPAVVGIELENSSSLNALKDRMKERGFFGEYLNEKPDLFQFLV